MNDGITRWAQALLQFSNLCFVVIDTTSVKRDSDVIRFLTLDKHGKVQDSVIICSARYPTSPNTEWTGITQEEMSRGLALEKVWDGIVVPALTGKFVLAYGFDFIQDHLDENAQHYGLEPVCMVGECLMQTAVEYFRSTNYGMKLTEACKRIGYILPDRPLAKQRAEGQLALLKAMAEGRTASAPTPSSDEGPNDLELHPF